MPETTPAFVRTGLAFALLLAAFRSTVAQDDTPIAAGAPQSVAADREVSLEDSTLHFAFDRTPWRDVIEWLAESSDLALHVTELPSGSFSYSDNNQFTPQQALDRVNLFLLPQGFTLVRSGRLLSVINLSDPRSVQQLNSLAKPVTVAQLDDLENHEVARCFFPLTELQPEEAIEELSALNLMTTPAVFPRTNQILVTDTAGKLRNVKAILDAFEPHALANGTVVKTFTLQHVDAEEILTVARPHLGLATGEMIGIDVSVSADPQGRSIFVTGIQDKVKMLEGLITEIDRPEKSLRPESGTAELRSHLVQGGNVETVYNVLQTLLATESRPIRLSVDETAGSIVALATPDIQQEIAETVAKLAGSEAEFEVIPLRTVDPYFAISLLEEMLDLSQPVSTDSRRDRDDDEPVAEVPKLDADPANMRLFVRAKRHQIDQIKSIIAGLDTTESADSPTGVRVFPLRGPQAEDILETAAKFWRAANPIILLPAVSSRTTEPSERIVA
ncbi:MAG: secretin N-terminal domain-containing protein, partial [Planctomycetota bacterium]